MIIVNIDCDIPLSGSRDTTFILDILKSVKVPEFVPKSGILLIK